MTTADNDLATIVLRSAARTLAMLPTEQLARHVRDCEESLARAETIGCMFDPTACLNAANDGTLDDARLQWDIAKHLLAARRAIDKREQFVSAKAADRETGRTP
jgi:hypothetical protein